MAWPVSIDLDALLAAARVVPVLTVRTPALAVPLAEALAGAGLVCAEVALRTPDSDQVLKAMAAHGGLTVGAGTVLTPGDAERAHAAGAAFLVSPGLDEEVLAAGRRLGIPVLPGVSTATELMRALRYGVGTLKFFPAEQAGGAAAVKALTAPFPAVRFMPTGGIGPGQVRAYLEVPSVLAVGGGWIAPPDVLERCDFAQIRRLAAQAVELGAR
jgi:2-dehydro-3-deoxyphosphogluconate aldolase/(4S)-4-hydroxy-2-oxoglutarate aldolase